MNFLKGYLTYLMAAVAVVFGIYCLITGTYLQNIEAMGMIWAGLGLFGIRRAI